MNSKIKELYKQSVVKETRPTGSDGQLETWYHHDANLFAELIIKECARIDSEENNPDHVDGETYNQTILRYFGAE